MSNTKSKSIVILNRIADEFMECLINEIGAIEVSSFKMIRADFKGKAVDFLDAWLEKQEPTQPTEEKE